MKYLLVILFSLVFGFSYSQKFETKLINSFSLQADTFIGIDDFENVYYIKNNTFFKKSNNEILTYTNISLGQITSIDIQNPFKIVLFYKDFNSIIILDNKLNELTNRIDFTNETLFNNVMLVSHSSENNLWLFADDNKLHLFNFQNHSEKIQTQPITFYQNNFIPIDLQSTYKNVWVLAKNGIIQFNEYGNFIQYSSIDNVSVIFPLRKTLIYFKDNSFYYLKNKKSISIPLEYNQIIKNIHINNTMINIFNGTNIFQYKLKS
ncbi:MAG: hypothetical protein KAH72_10015 [Flavobacteriaceae bacterium]|nr:hypothetical protein [Flavobacteriaceae bacterium]